MAGSARAKIVTPAASGPEAAAIIAAVEQFLQDTAPPPSAQDLSPAGWERTALLEGVVRDDDGLSAWGDGQPWG